MSRHNVFLASMMVLLLSAPLFAQAGEYDTGYTGAWEIDYSRCDRGGVDTTAYCDGYCEYMTEDECEYVSHIPSETSGMIDQCVCTCGVSQYEVVYDSVPCMDITRYGSPSGFGTGPEGDFCCLPAFVLIGAAGLAMMKQD